MRSFGRPSGWILLVALVAAGAAAAQTRDDDAPKRQPTIVNSAETRPAYPLAPPRPLPPPGLEGVEGSPLDVARGHLSRVEVLDALGIRLSRQLRLLLQDDPSAERCAVVASGARALRMALDEAERSHRTAAAHLEPASTADPVAEPTAEAGEWLVQFRARLDHLGGLRGWVDDELSAADCEDDTVAPAFYLPPESLAAVDGRAAIFVRADAASRVVWVDEVPWAVSGPDGWTVLVVPEGDRRVCIAPGADPTCDGGYVASATMGAAFDLR